LIGGVFGGIVEDVTDKIANSLATQVRVENLLREDGY
jgi:hypothetical protein